MKNDFLQNTVKELNTKHFELPAVYLIPFFILLSVDIVYVLYRLDCIKDIYSFSNQILVILLALIKFVTFLYTIQKNKRIKLNL